MSNKKVIIVGGVAGGASTAARLRRLDENAEILLIEKGEHVSFANCGLPYYVGDVISNREDLLVQSAENMQKRFNLDVRIKTEAVSIDRDKKELTLKNLETDETYRESYDYIVLSPGSKPIMPPIPGLDKANNVFALKTISDSDKIKDYLKNNNAKKAVVVGGGFIGIEIAENLKEKGLDVYLVEMLPQVLPNLDFEMASIVEEHLEEKGIKLILGDALKEVGEDGKTLILNSNTEIKTDMIVMSVGVVPESKFALDANLEAGVKNSIKVDEYMQTSDPSIYAVGDAVEVEENVNTEPAVIPLAGPANRQGRGVANNIYGDTDKVKSTLGTSVIKVFELTAASTGANEKQLKELNKNYRTVHIHPFNQVKYYPGANKMSLKLLFDPEDGTIYGAQAVGKTGVEKRIDVIATAIKGRLSVYTLKELDLCYAPPYSSAKDPVNMLGFVAENIVNNLVKSIDANDFISMDIDEKNILVIDVRDKNAAEENGIIEGALNIPVNEVRDRLSEIPKDKKIVVYCDQGLNSYLVSRILLQNNYEVYNLDGGYQSYKYAKRKLESK
ncbi:FAD-dependent oxidoreductase [Natranaerofaba carboxydovora]|uniref:FAD-dependent oxidoreductase n=1 Tax=Natranaerofaba carboxydovora TaxID=2742683 RepID=UPI001F129700|nr:FAD-dependent oxidoreductase [Natranaerofaba carboxydovora]UMZ74336.1 Coenzyme A disulfide reductase [Natranaerofaba carboxydovora]